MNTTITSTTTISEDLVKVVLLFPGSDLSTLELSDRESGYISKKKEEGSSLISINNFGTYSFYIPVPEAKHAYLVYEKLRQKGHELQKLLQAEKIENVLLLSNQEESLEELLALAEGLALSTYGFSKYKTKKENIYPAALHILTEEQEAVEELAQVIKAVHVSRTLVNEPVICLTAEQLREEIRTLGKEAGFQVEIFHKAKIRSLKMGGLLAVNAGSIDPPTFTIMEYKSPQATNTKPVVLVGKGVVYDTGGLSLKPTPSSMDLMKSDMAGAAAVIAAVYAAASNKLPIHIIGLIPATDNRPGENAITPGDVIKMFDGTWVEILNTDAEGRLILADALSYAKKYDPALVIDLATLTGSAARAIGKEGIVYMGTASDSTKEQMEEAGHRVHERLVEFPLWEEYESHIKSDIADINNLGKAEAGAISAGIFLKHFTDYPWLHFDIAGTAFLTSPDSYRGKGGTGSGVRLLYQFLKNYTEATVS
jgi:leucyl aminopeptidase